MFALMLVAIALLPFCYGFGEFELGVVTLNPYVLSMVLLSVGVFFQWIIGVRRGGVDLKDIPMILLATTYLVSTLLSENVLEAGFLAFHALFVPITTYFVVRTIVDSEKRYTLTVWVFFLSVVGLALAAISAYLVSSSRGAVVGLPPIGMATVSVAALVCAFPYWKQGFKRLLGGIVFSGFLLTFSRAYLVALLLAPLVFKGFKRANALYLFSAFLVSTLLATTLVSFNAEVFRPLDYDKAVESTSSRLTDMNFLLGSLYGRALTYREGLEGFLEAPAFGEGFSKGEFMVTQHNFHVEWLQYGGLAGYLLYAYVLFSFFSRAAKFVRRDLLVGVNTMAVFLLLFNSLTNGLMHGIMPTVLFLVLALTESRIKLLRSNPIRWGG